MSDEYVDYDYQDYDGRKLEIRSGEGGCALVDTQDERVSVAAGDLPEITAKLYEAAGLPAPVILERPEIDPDAWLQSGPVRMGLTGDGEVAVAVGNAQSSATPSDIRHIAALLCAYADAAEAEPDPAEVKELAALLGKAFDGADGGFAPHDAAVEEQARAVLRKYRLEARS